LLSKGEHVVSLFFSSVVKIKPIKVRSIFVQFYYLQSIDSPFVLFVTQSTPNSFAAFSVVLGQEWLYGYGSVP
jgi:hypothetical protein